MSDAKRYDENEIGSATFIFLAVVTLLQLLSDGANLRGLFTAAMFGAMGVGGLAERIPLLLKD